MSKTPRQHPILHRLVLLGTLLALGGCSWFSWVPGIGEGGEDAEEPAALVEFDAEVDLRREWRAGVGSGLGKKYVRLKPQVVADRIIAADAYGLVAAFDRFSGKKVWQQQVGEVASRGWSLNGLMDRKDPSFISGGVGAGEGLALIGSTRGEVIALEVADGSLAWRTYAGAEIGAAPAVSREGVFVQTIDGQVLALDKDSGEIIWRYGSQVPLLTLRGTSAPVAQQGLVFAGFASGKVVALRAENGEPVWEQRIMLPEGRSELDRIVDIDAQPLISGSALYALAYQGRVMSLSLRDGRPRWQQEVSGHQNMAQGYGQIYIVDGDDTVYAIDQQSGDITWQHELLARRKLSPPLAFSNYLLVGDDEGYLHVQAQLDGRMMGREKVSGDELRAQMVVADGTLYVLDNGGSLSAYRVTVK